MMWRDWFYSRKSDRRIMLALLVLFLLCFMVLLFVDGQQAETAVQDNEADSMQARTVPETPAAYYDVATVPAERFRFDPNTADSTQLLALGLQPWQVRNIYKYRAAGGIYRQKEDFARLYGLTVKQYRELEPYIVISPEYLPAATLVGERAAFEGDTLRFPRKISEGETIELSGADTTMLKTVPGIGSYYARKVVNYGSALGGYVSLDQLDEIEGFPADAKQYLTISSVNVRTLAINRLSLNELKRHPYINYYQAKAIVDHRRLYGPISDLSELSLLPDFNNADIARLRPYVNYDD